MVAPLAWNAGALLDGWTAVVRGWVGARTHVLGQVAAAPGLRGRPVLRLWFPGGTRRALLVAGTHGDEPAGANALLRFFASGEAAALAAQAGWSFDVLPLVNPLGYDDHTRGRAGCPDLNREFGERPGCPETEAILRSLGTGGATAAADRRWDLALSLHEDPEASCLYLYDTGCRERHRFVAALAQSTRFLDWAEGRGVESCRTPFVEDAPNHGGVLVAAQNEFPALEPTLYRSGRAERVVIVETPGRLALETRVALHTGALRHYLGSGRAAASRAAAPRTAASRRTNVRWPPPPATRTTTPTHIIGVGR